MANITAARVLIITGGTSSEAEVARNSAKEVATALQGQVASIDVLECDANLLARLDPKAYDVVFPVLHGCPGEDGTVQGYLELLGLPYVGSGVKASSIAMDKIIAKVLFRAANLPVAREVVVGAEDDLANKITQIQQELGASVVVKPYGQGSAVGVQFAQTAEELAQGIQQAMQFDERVLVEQCITGMEVTVAVLEKPDGIITFPSIEIVTPEGQWYDFEHRYTVGLYEHIIPARLNDATQRALNDIAIAAHRAVDCRDYSRVDFVVPESGEPVLLEVNTIPGLTATSLYPDTARVAGMSTAELYGYLIERALTRC